MFEYTLAANHNYCQSSCRPCNEARPTLVIQTFQTPPDIHDQAPPTQKMLPRWIDVINALTSFVPSAACKAGVRRICRCLPTFLKSLNANDPHICLTMGQQSYARSRSHQRLLPVLLSKARQSFNVIHDPAVLQFLSFAADASRCDFRQSVKWTKAYVECGGNVRR